MKTNALFICVALATTISALWALPAGATDNETSAAEERLDQLVDRAVGDGSAFFTFGDRAVIERACGYAPGTWDGSGVNMIGDVFHCMNGRRVSSPEVRAAVAAASRRIKAHVDAVMKRPEIVAALRQVEREAEAHETRTAKR